MNIQDFTQKNASQIDGVLGALLLDSEEKISPRDLANWVNSKTDRVVIGNISTSNILIPTTASFLTIPAFVSDFCTVDQTQKILTMTKKGFLKGKLRLNVLSTSAFVDLQTTDGAGVVRPNTRRRIESEDSSIEFSFENFANIGDQLKFKIKASGVANLQYLPPDADFGGQEPYTFSFEFIEELPISAILNKKTKKELKEAQNQAFSSSPKPKAGGEMTVYGLNPMTGAEITSGDIVEFGTLAGEEKKITYQELFSRFFDDLPIWLKGSKISHSSKGITFPQGSGKQNIPIKEIANRNFNLYSNDNDIDFFVDQIDLNKAFYLNMSWLIPTHTGGINLRFTIFGVSGGEFNFGGINTNILTSGDFIQTFGCLVGWFSIELVGENEVLFRQCKITDSELETID